jgi:hypothetical protein
MHECETPAWFDRWPQCRLLLDLTQLAVRTGRPETLDRLAGRLQACRARLKSAPLLVDTTVAELALAVALALQGDLAGARRHTQEASCKASRVDRLRREVLRRKARWLCANTKILRVRTRQLMRESAALVAASRARARAADRDAPAAPLEPLSKLASIA